MRYPRGRGFRILNSQLILVCWAAVGVVRTVMSPDGNDDVVVRGGMHKYTNII